MGSRFKLLLFVALLAAFALLSISTSASAEKLPIESWDISKSESDSVFAELYLIDNSAYSLTIYGEGEMCDFSLAYAAPWTEYAYEIKCVSIARGVENLSTYALIDCVFAEKIIFENPEIRFVYVSNTIPLYAELYAHNSSTVNAFASTEKPSRVIYSICTYDDGVCSVCGYECTSHTGGLANCKAGAICETCGLEYTDKTEAHTEGIPATCKSRAVCSVCEEEYGEKLTTHTGGVATCTDSGFCTVCGCEYVSKKPHSYSEKIEKLSPSCEADGLEAHYRCFLCEGYFDLDKRSVNREELKIPMSHNFGELVPYSPADCDDFGIVAHYRCSICNKNFDENKTELDNIYIGANGHAGGEATCTEKAKCEICGESYGTLDGDNHTYTHQYDEDAHFEKCVCGDVKNIYSHVFFSKVLNEPTVESEGVREYSCSCGYSYSEQIPKLNKPEDTVILPDNQDENKNEDENVLKKVLFISVPAVSIFVVCFIVILKIRKTR